MNLADSERMAGVLESLGYACAEEPGDADVLIYNTCRRGGGGRARGCRTLPGVEQPPPPHPRTIPLSSPSKEYTASPPLF